MRKPLIAANWKMYKTPQEAKSFLREFLPLMQEDPASPITNSEIVICPPTIDLLIAVDVVSGCGVFIGAQNMAAAEEGAFTGETSAGMLTSIEVTHVILGHSERRHYFAETDETVNAKLHTALKHNLTPIVCLGERLEQREAGQTEEVLVRHVAKGLADVTAESAEKLVIAYEPIWAIGTGRTATPAIAAEAHLIIRSEIARLLGRPFADQVRILYGGSVKPENARELLQQPEIDGALVGGASLEPTAFAKIVLAAH